MKFNSCFLFGLFIFFVFIIAFFYSIKVGIQKSEEIECRKWLIESDNYEGYCLVPWQVAQCQVRGFEVEPKIECKKIK